MNEHDMILGELRGELRGLRDELAEAKRDLRDGISQAKMAADAARNHAETVSKEFASMRNRGYGFLAGVTMAAGAAGATIKSVFFGN